MPSDAPPDATPQAGALHQVVQAIARDLDPSRIGTGALAMLRRLDPTRAPTEPALHRLLAEHADAWVDRDGIGVWTLIVHAMALAAPGRLRSGAGLGDRLFAADYKEGRMTRLLEARADELPVIVPRAVRFLVAHEQTLDPVALAWFVRGIEGGGEAAERQRTRVARDYYRAAYAAATANSLKSQAGPVA